MFLTKEDLNELTDFKTAHAQCRWLTEHGYPFDKSASGKPKVLKTYIEQRLNTQAITNQYEQPNFDAIR